MKESFSTFINGFELIIIWMRRFIVRKINLKIHRHFKYIHKWNVSLLNTFILLNLLALLIQWRVLNTQMGLQRRILWSDHWKFCEKITWNHLRLHFPVEVLSLRGSITYYNQMIKWLTAVRTLRYPNLTTSYLMEWFSAFKHCPLLYGVSTEIFWSLFY